MWGGKGQRSERGSHHKRGEHHSAKWRQLSPECSALDTGEEKRRLVTVSQSRDPELRKPDCPESWMTVKGAGRAACILGRLFWCPLCSRRGAGETVKRLFSQTVQEGRGPAWAHLGQRGHGQVRPYLCKAEKRLLGLSSRGPWGSTVPLSLTQCK